MMSPIYLGEPLFDGRTYTRVEPLAVAHKGAWRTVQNWSKRLPTEGKAFAPRQLPFQRGQVFAFDTQPNTRRETDGDLCLVDECSEVAEVMDFRNRDPETARRALVEIGLKTLAPGTNKVIAALPDGVCVVVPMERLTESKTFVASLQGLDELPVHSFDPSVFDGDRIEGRIFSIPNVTVGSSISATNWSRDVDFIETVLRRLRKVTAAGTPPVPLARMGSVAAYLGRAGLTPALGADLEPLRTRMSSVAATLGDNLTAVDDLVDLVSSLRPIEERLEERLETSLAERLTAAETKVRAEAETRLKGELDALEHDVATRRMRLEAELADLEALVQIAREETTEVKEAREELQVALRDELLALEGEVEGGLADVGVESRALLGRIGTRLRSRGANVELTAADVPPWARTRLKVQGDARPWDALAQTLDASAKRFGYAPDELLVADVAVRAGAFVVLPQSEAANFIRCHASVMAWGEVIRQVLDPSILSVDDVWRQPGGGKPTAFANAWVAAHLDARRYRIVLLDGLQRTPMDLWLPSLMEVLATPARPRNLLIFATLGERPIDPGRLWRGLESAAVAFHPTPKAGVTADLLAGATGTPGTASGFDAADVPAPNRADLLAFTDDYPGDPERDALRRVTEVLRSAWPFSPTINPTEMALAFAPTTDEGRYRRILADGAAWLRSITNTWE